MEMQMYNQDVEMVMDFMKLSILFDSSTDEECIDILKLQYGILELLPTAQSNRMGSIYEILGEIYTKNKNECKNRIKDDQKTANGLDTIPYETNKDDNYIVLFYCSLCKRCNKIMNDWNKFKEMNKEANFTVKEFDKNTLNDGGKMFNYFEVNDDMIPIVYKFRLGENDNNKCYEIMDNEVNLLNLTHFANF